MAANSACVALEAEEVSTVTEIGAVPGAAIVVLLSEFAGHACSTLAQPTTLANAMLFFHE
jgi:hypothetical protein